jgi:hypothetical protein
MAVTTARISEMRQRKTAAQPRHGGETPGAVGESGGSSNGYS